MNIEDIYELATRELKTRRSLAIQSAESNKIKALENDEYKSIANKIGELTISIAKARVNNLDATKLEKELVDAENDEKVILSKMNLKKEDLEPKFKCNICNDKGFYNNHQCSCFKDLIAYYCNRYNLNMLQPITFKDCDKIDKKILDTMNKLANAYPQNKTYTTILIVGDVGVGKTQLSQAVANAFIEKGLYTIFTSATNLNSNFLDYHKCFNENKNLYLHHFLECDVLVIDDLGTEPMLNNVTKEYLLMLISERKLVQKLTIISTNLTATELTNRYGERLVSRLLDYKSSISIEIKGKDLRLRKNN
ncbi:MAG: ATP-binding protein [Christensenellales bacterium]